MPIGRAAATLPRRTSLLGRLFLLEGEDVVPKKALKQVPKGKDAVPSLDYLAAALKKQSKETLVKMLMEIASTDRVMQRELEVELDVHAPDNQIIPQTREAIADATYFDEDDYNTNFDYDSRAYELVEKNFRKLVQMKAWADVMNLSLELLRDGSAQAEASDEADMASDIEDCLKPVIEALANTNLPRKVIVDWCDQMKLADKIGCICVQELVSLRQSLP